MATTDKALRDLDCESWEPQDIIIYTQRAGPDILLEDVDSLAAANHFFYSIRNVDIPGITQHRPRRPEDYTSLFLEDEPLRHPMPIITLVGVHNITGSSNTVSIYVRDSSEIPRIIQSLFIIARGINLPDFPNWTHQHNLGGVVNYMFIEQVEQRLSELGLLTQENPSYYHGSPYSGLDLAAYENEILFVTPSPSVAHHYTVVLPASGRRPRATVLDKKTIYTFDVNINQEDIFDTRYPEHENAYQEIRNELKKILDPEDWPSKRLVATPSLPDSTMNTSGYFPDFGSGLEIVTEFKNRGFRALWVSEGSQGASLGLFYPEEDAEIVDIEYLD